MNNNRVLAGFAFGTTPQDVTRNRSIGSAVRAVCFGLVLLGLASGAAQAQVVTEFSTLPAGNSEPHRIVAGADGNLWFTEILTGKVGRITPTGVVTEYNVISPSIGAPNGITAGPAGPGPANTVWVTVSTVFGANVIVQISPLGGVWKFTAGISADAGLGEITTGPDGNLWFTEGTGNRIGRITTAGTVTEFSAGISAGAGPGAITAGPDGNLWFAEYTGNRIGRITTSGTVTEFGVGISAGAQPGSIAVGADGNLWFTEPLVNRIGRITTAGVVTEFSAGISAGARPLCITAGPDGNLWFTEYVGSRIGRITTAGAVTEFSAGISAGSGPQGITVGPDKALWFVEQEPYVGNRVARITTGSGCTEDALTLCLIGGRYKVTSYWKNQYAGGATLNLNKAHLTDATGAFWQADASTYEYLIRINTATNNGKAWIAIPTFTDVEFWIQVLDTVGGQAQTYHSPAGNRTLIYDPSFFVYP